MKDTYCSYHHEGTLTQVDSQYHDDFFDEYNIVIDTYWIQELRNCLCLSKNPMEADVHNYCSHKDGAIPACTAEEVTLESFPHRHDAYGRKVIAKRSSNIY